MQSAERVNKDNESQAVKVNVTPLPVPDGNSRQVRKLSPEEWDQYELAKKWLIDNYYFLNETGGQRQFFSVRDNKGGYMAGHLLSAMVNDPDLDVDWKVAKYALKNVRLQAMRNEPIYRPEQPATLIVNGIAYPNLWREPEVKPLQGSVDTWLAHLLDMMGSQEKVDYFVRMLAYRMQNPDLKTKPPVAFFIFSERHGMGKGLLLHTIAKVFGSTALMKLPDEQSLKSLSAVDCWRRTWVAVEETNIKKGGLDYNKLKTMVSADTVDTDRKNAHFSRYETPAQLIMFSNSSPNFLEEHDRRFCVIRFQKDFESEEAKEVYFENLVHWLEAYSGFERIAHYLRYEVDLTGFRLSSHALMTEEKREAISMMVDHAVVALTDHMAEHPKRLLWTENEFDMLLCQHRVDSKAHKYKLQEAGLTPQQAVKLQAGTGRRTYTFWAVPGYRLLSRQGAKPAIIGPDGKEQALSAFNSGYDGN